MRIGYIHVDYEEWTVDNYNVQEIGLAKAFEQLGHETIIVYWVKRNSIKCFTEVNVTSKIKKVYLPGIHFRHHILFNCHLLKKYKFDLLHIQSDNLFYVPEITAWCRRNLIPYYCYVGTIESSNPNKLQRIFVNFITHRNIRTFSKSIVFVKTPAMAEQLESLGVANPHVAPVGLDLSIIPEVRKTKTELREELGLSRDKNIIICVCALRPSKHPMDIFKLANSLNDNFEIVYIGDGPLHEEFERRYSDIKTHISFRYIPKIPNTDMHKYYKAADYFVNFNPDEIFGMAILEAMYQNCTVIARHAPGPDYIIQNGKTGYLVDTVEEMAKIIGYKVSLGILAKERIEQNFKWINTTKNILRIMEEKT